MRYALVFLSLRGENRVVSVNLSFLSLYHMTLLSGLASSRQSNVPIWSSDFIHESVDGRSRCCEGQAKCVGLSIVALFESHFVESFILALRSPAGREMSPDDAFARAHSYSFMPFHSYRFIVLVYR